MKKERGITLISLIITIIILIILAAVTVYFVVQTDIIENVLSASEETNKQTATEKINLKITNCQINYYAIEKRMPTLQEMADDLCEDEEIQYVTTKTQTASLDKVPIGTADSIFTKLYDYPYEFEINSSLQLASINGIKLDKAENNEKTFVVFLDGKEIDYFPEINNNVKLISANATNGAKIEIDENNFNIKISNLSNVNTKFQLNYMTINDYKKLMELAGIQSNFSNIYELISDQEALEKVFASNEATQYILKSEELIKAIRDSQAAMNNIANSEKLMYKIIKNDESRNIILNSSYISLIDNASVKAPTLSNDNGKIIYSSCMNGYYAWSCFDENNTTTWRPVHGENFLQTYIGYNFGEDLICYKIGIRLINGQYSTKTRQATFESSIDGSNWNKLIDTFSITPSNTETYYYYPTNMNAGKYFRFKGVSGDTLQEYGQYAHDVAILQFYCVKVVND